MKTQLIISAAFWMLFSMVSMASAPKKEFTLNDSFGRTLTMPVAVEEECSDCLPFDSQAIFHQIMMERVESNIDITDMIKPEEEVDDMPSELKEILANMLK